MQFRHENNHTAAFAKQCNELATGIAETYGPSYDKAIRYLKDCHQARVKCGSKHFETIAKFWFPNLQAVRTWPTTVSGKTWHFTLCHGTSNQGNLWLGNQYLACTRPLWIPWLQACHWRQCFRAYGDEEKWIVLTAMPSMYSGFPAMFVGKTRYCGFATMFLKCIVHGFPNHVSYILWGKLHAMASQPCLWNVIGENSVLLWPPSYVIPRL